MAGIRAYREGDREDIYEICLKTGRSGEDATGWLENDDLLPDIYALPYVDYAPETAFVVEADGRARGYILAAADTRAFVERLRGDWLPAFQEKYRSVTDPTTRRFVKDGMHPKHLLIPELSDYPAHLHIDLLPELQGKGWGRMLVRTLLSKLAADGVPGVWLEYGPDNRNAGAFYRKLGFAPLRSGRHGTRVAIRTDAVV